MSISHKSLPVLGYPNEGESNVSGAERADYCKKEPGWRVIFWGRITFDDASTDNTLVEELGMDDSIR